MKLTKHRLVVELEVEAASLEDAVDVVDAVLDAGTFQDAINDLSAEEDDEPVHVTSAIVRLALTSTPERVVLSRAS